MLDSLRGWRHNTRDFLCSSFHLLLYYFSYYFFNIICQQNWRLDQLIEMVGKVVTAPCRFPSLSPHTSSHRNRDEDAVHTIDILQEDNSLSQWGSDLGPRLRVIWAIILSVFVYDDSVVMAYEECTDSQDSTYLLQHCPFVYTTTIDREDDLNTLVESGHLLENDHHGHRVYNTGVLLLDGRSGRSDLGPKHSSSPTNAERVSKAKLHTQKSNNPAHNYLPL